MEWFLYNRDLRQERVKRSKILNEFKQINFHYPLYHQKTTVFVKILGGYIDLGIKFDNSKYN